MLSQGLSALGINVYYHTVVGDNPQRLRAAVSWPKAGRTFLLPPAAWAPPATI